MLPRSRPPSAGFLLVLLPWKALGDSHLELEVSSRLSRAG